MNVSKAFSSAATLQKDVIRVAKEIDQYILKGKITPEDIQDSYTSMKKTVKMANNPIKKACNFCSLFFKMLISKERPSRLNKVITLPTPTESQLAEINEILKK